RRRSIGDAGRETSMRTREYSHALQLPDTSVLFDDNDDLAPQADDRTRAPSHSSRGARAAGRVSGPAPTLPRSFRPLRRPCRRRGYRRHATSALRALLALSASNDVPWPTGDG